MLDSEGRGSRCNFRYAKSDTSIGTDMVSKGLKILLVDDEPIKCEILKDHLIDVGHEVELVSSPLNAEVKLKKKAFDVIITDIRMQGKDGITFLREIKEKNTDQAVIVMTAYGTVESAVEAMKLGAYDYLQKPFSGEELLLKLDRLAQFTGLVRENKALRERLAAAKPAPVLIGQSLAIREVQARIHAVASNESNILIQGRSGTGKEVVAKLIHQCSHRSKGPFVPVSCAALPEGVIESELFGHEAGAFTGAAKARPGRFEMANGGTLFLDDIDDVPMSIQVKLLRAIQERKIERVGGTKSISVDIRLITATKVDLRKLVEEGKFREDMFYRLSVIPIDLADLKDRVDDVPLLVAHFLEIQSRRQNRSIPSISPEVLELLNNYSWPGNVRELEHTIEQVVALHSDDVILKTDLPENIRRPARAKCPLSVNMEGYESVDMQAELLAAEKELIDWAMRRADDNLAHAAEMLGMPRSTFQYRLSKVDQPPTQD